MDDKSPHGDYDPPDYGDVGDPNNPYFPDFIIIRMNDADTETDFYKALSDAVRYAHRLDQYDLDRIADFLSVPWKPLRGRPPNRELRRWVFFHHVLSSRGKTISGMRYTDIIKSIVDESVRFGPKITKEAAREIYLTVKREGFPACINGKKRQIY